MCIGVKRSQCNCEGCQVHDCGKCTNCLDMKKFGGPGRKKQRCAKRNCQAQKTRTRTVKVPHTNIHTICT